MPESVGVGVVVEEHATPATTSVAPPKTIAARVARENGDGSAALSVDWQNGHVESDART